jgi:hypothetical protein
MDKFHEPSNSECCTPSSEPFGFYQIEFMSLSEFVMFVCVRKRKEKVVGLERGPLSLVSTTEELLDRKVAAPV